MSCVWLGKSDHSIPLFIRNKIYLYTLYIIRIGIYRIVARLLNEIPHILRELPRRPFKVKIKSLWLSMLNKQNAFPGTDEVIRKLKCYV